MMLATSKLPLDHPPHSFPSVDSMERIQRPEKGSVSRQRASGSPYSCMKQKLPHVHPVNLHRSVNGREINVCHVKTETWGCTLQQLTWPKHLLAYQKQSWDFNPILPAFTSTTLPSRAGSKTGPTPPAAWDVSP